ncbi:uncharacterized protein LOC131851511 [Achroia grisella]|uniref:uncharacterized protein LOC131851511 n=1 Tax=Achroia grisella TaxID=688607 RepID=UPI0027D34528|nr:uncharacterized protein LOC131851511 [Achroia grisella]
MAMMFGFSQTTGMTGMVPIEGTGVRIHLGVQGCPLPDPNASLMNGEVTFDLRLSDVGYERVRYDGNQTGDPPAVRARVTAAEAVGCVYQIPEKRQADAILSNLMNELVKVYVRAREYIQGIINGRRKHNKRYFIVSIKNSTFFEDIYFEMMQEFKQLYGETESRVVRSKTPCDQQLQLQNLWRQLLDRSLAALQRATTRCVDELLVETSLKEKIHARRKLMQFLVGEMERIRSSQLDLLCDHFQLCYNELL